MKRFIPLLLLMLVLLTPTCVLAAESAENVNTVNPTAETAKEPSHVTITVVMPDAPREEAEPPSLPELPELSPEPIPAVPKLYPTDVSETSENGVRWIVKTYELGAGDNPADIPREDFERYGWAYSLADITKKVTAAADSRDHAETVTVNTDTKDMAAILPLLAPTMEFTAEDGYYGVLALDVSSVTVEQAGTKTSNYTATVKREYPHLSSNDTALVPKTVSENGRTYTLASVDWKSQTTETVDYDQLPASYTATASYTAAASKTVVTGYITTAQYKGTLSKLNEGATVYTAYFMGEEIIPERIPLEFVGLPPSPTSEPAPEAGAEPDCTGAPAVTAEPGTEESSAEEDGEAESGETESNPLVILIPAALLILLLGAAGGFYITRVIENKKRGASDE